MRREERHRSPAGSIVPGRLVRTCGTDEGVLEHGKLPDPAGQATDDLARRIADLEQQARALREERMRAR